MRRVHVPDLFPGDRTADPAQGRHLRDVLRLTAGDAVEAFDAAGRTAVATVVAVVPDVVLRIDAVAPPPAVRAVVVASAVPKGDRADWMVEKLSELGVARFVPLRTARSVVHPENHKLDRWRRIAVEAAKQSRRSGVLAIDPLTPLADWLPTLTNGTYFSTRPAVRPFRPAADDAAATVLLIGPEGGWTDDEASAFDARGLTPAGLGRTILRIETAALLAAGSVALSGANEGR